MGTFHYESRGDICHRDMENFKAQAYFTGMYRMKGIKPEI